ANMVPEAAFLGYRAEILVPAGRARSARIRAGRRGARTLPTTPQAGTPVFVPGPHDSIMAGLNCGTVSLIARPGVAAGVDVFTAIGDGAAEDAMRELAAMGVVAGETGAASLAGFHAVIECGAVEPHGQRALGLCADGATVPVAYERVVGIWE
ncbi:MAG TPA: hypothetical protein VK771_09965, partial [Acidimicrobiia bacterium]|nr:hypothetical protein [Acidimicrobiia bacterium]